MQSCYIMWLNLEKLYNVSKIVKCSFPFCAVTYDKAKTPIAHYHFIFYPFS